MTMPYTPCRQCARLYSAWRAEADKNPEGSERRTRARIEANYILLSCAQIHERTAPQPFEDDE